MKISKILAGMSAMALAASMMTMGASAAITGADSNGNMIYDVKTLTEANNIKISDVYGVRAYFSDSAAGVVEQGAGGGFIFSSKSNDWNQKQWCNCFYQQSDIHLFGKATTYISCAWNCS